MGQCKGLACPAAFKGASSFIRVFPGLSSLIIDRIDHLHVPHNGREVKDAAPHQPAHHLRLSALGGKSGANSTTGKDRNKAFIAEAIDGPFECRCKVCEGGVESVSQKAAPPGVNQKQRALTSTNLNW